MKPSTNRRTSRSANQHPLLPAKPAGPSRAMLAALAGAAVLATLTGCLTRASERTIVVTSEPPGATVWLNDVEIGRTPTEASFKFFGTYDLQLRLDGYEPVHEGRTAHAPLHEQPGFDLLAAAWPWRPRHEVAWHFDLEPTPERTLPTEELDAQLIERARQAAAMLNDNPDATPPSRSPTEPTGESPTQPEIQPDAESEADPDGSRP